MIIIFFFQFKEALAKNNFTFYNSTSISHLIITSSGFNGINVRKQSIELLTRYVIRLT